MKRTLSFLMLLLVLFTVGLFISCNADAVDTVFKPTLPKYTVTFDMQGHGTQVAAMTDVVSGSKIVEPEKPQETDYKFLGWFKESEYNTKWNFANDSVTADITLYARWIKNSEVSNYTMKKGTEWFSTLVNGTNPAIEKTSITEIIFSKVAPTGAKVVDGVDLTAKGTGKVKGYIIPNSDNYKIYIVGEYIFGNDDCQQMFKGFSNLKTLDLRNFDTSEVTNMYCMFNGCSSLTSIAFDEGFDTSEVTDMSGMFGMCSGLTSITFGEGFDTAKVTTMLMMFNNCSALKSLDLSKFNTASVTTMKQMFSGCSGLTSITFGDKFNAEKVTDMNNMFDKCSELTSLDLSKFNSKSAQNMSAMFQSCTKLSEITFGTNFNTASVTTMEKMFNNCTALTTLDLSSFNTVNVSNMNSMFFGCSALTSLNLSNFNTGNVTNMGAMFKGCSALTLLDLSNFNTENVTIMGSMFEGCSALTSLDLSNFNTENVTSMGIMFVNCSNLASVKISAENEKIVSALGDGWTYKEGTKAYEKN